MSRDKADQFRRLAALWLVRPLCFRLPGPFKRFNEQRGFWALNECLVKRQSCLDCLELEFSKVSRLPEGVEDFEVNPIPLCLMEVVRQTFI